MVKHVVDSNTINICILFIHELGSNKSLRLSVNYANIFDVIACIKHNSLNLHQAKIIITKKMGGNHSGGWGRKRICPRRKTDNVTHLFYFLFFSSEIIVAIRLIYFNGWDLV